MLSIQEAVELIQSLDAEWMIASHPLCQGDEVCYLKKLNLRGPRDTEVELEFKK